ncbi:shikimate kinase [Conchiformibius kuhniae]|uniref:Shikimate kinase n=1 Tax=Conchiformibius kuhniae TaxID=211502 RepID=A0A8T9MWF5_9NEIS
MNDMAGNIFFVGLMGAGKTSLGRQLAARLARTFYDSDQVICERTGVSVPTIFELEGESGFRERERQAIDELTRLQGIVLATGGGAVLRAENRECLHTRGTVVYLHVAPEVLFERTRHDRNRPLLQVDDPLRRLHELYRARDPLYRSVAHCVLDVGDETYFSTFKQLIELLSGSH